MSNAIDNFYEAAAFSEEQFQWMLRRLRMNSTQKLIVSSTPKSGKNWFYEHWKKESGKQDAVTSEET